MIYYSLENDYDDEDLTTSYTEEEYDDDEYYDEYDDEYSMLDVGVFILIMTVATALIAFLIKTLANSFKNLNLKVGDKIQLGIESHNSKNQKKK